MTTAVALERDVVLVTGPDAATYLQGQLSQDVAGLPVGGSAFSLLLQPQGKVDAWLRVTRTADDTFALDVDAGWGEHVLARLKRFLLRTKAELEPVDWNVVGVFGGDAAVPDGAFRAAAELDDELVYLGPGARGPAGAPAMAEGIYEQLRVRAGVPRMGRELDESTIPASAGIVDRSVSFTKGCYTGQELVARIDARGDRVPTKLRRVTGDVPEGATLHVEDREVGHVTSSAAGVALAYVRREVEPPADVVARWDGGETTVRIEA
jgi:folate-binding protein YgfZ